MTSLSLLQDLLRLPDEARVVLEAAVVTTSENQDPHNRRILAVVSHKEDWDLTEEGCLFVCKYKAGANGRAEELDVQRVLPIYGQFSVVIGQMRRGSSARPPSISSKVPPEQPRTVMTLDITPAEGPTHLPTYYTGDVHTLKAFVTECRRLKDGSDVEANAVINLASSTTHFSWLKPYFEKHSTIATLTSMPEDLRQINRPLLDRLSPSCAGFLGDEHSDAQMIRDDWVRNKAREMSRVGRRRLSLRLGTFNVNGKMPSQDLSPWVRRSVNLGDHNAGPGGGNSRPELPPMKNMSPLSLGGVARNPFNWGVHVTPRTPTMPSSPQQLDHGGKPLRVDLSDPEDPDLLVVGFQELDLSAEALIYSTGTVREDAWCLAVFAALGEKAVSYEKLISKQLVGMLIVIFVKKSLKDCFGDIRTSAAGAGILGVMGNKGGTAIRVMFTPPPNSSAEKSALRSPCPTSLTFVNAHLAAFDDMADKRNSDFQELSRRLSFEGIETTSFPLTPDAEGSNDRANIEPPTSPGTGAPPTVSVYETDVLFWMGDLNYRVDINDAEIRKVIADKEWVNGLKIEALLRFDQLKKSMESKKAFEGFIEAPITHLPTYRFSSGIAADKMGYDFKRKPAWTDRILYMHHPKCRVEQLSYTGHTQIMLSDHRPVAADFLVDVDLYDVALLRANVRKLLNDVHHLEGEITHERGGLQISNTYIDFENVSYGVPLERTISIRNTSKSPCAFRFVPVQLDAPIHPEWLSIHPKTGVLLPNETTNIVLMAQIDNKVASILNLRPKDLSGNLILHTVMGKDSFISVSGEYQYTCFANKLSRLTRLRGPIRSLGLPSDLLPENNAINAPREIMRLVNWMMSNFGNSDSMFLHSANATTVKTIIECLDTGNEFPYPPDTTSPDISVAFASTLLAFLESLPESIIPAPLHRRCLEMASRDEAFELLEELAPASVNVWISVTAFLHFVCQNSKDENHAVKIGECDTCSIVVDIYIIVREADVLAPILLRDDPSSSTPPISPAAKSHFLLYFIS
ncbi:hypothetical protein HYPSUDRAFT_136984 [Hypholoma sublateritium FD-334 SS-4]|uniref:Rho-GAP domain-containing protein n=1 Tax=Hypholoma sublateritium (strain FD-334 SS-4) TaxID=945553 RepID=A0A0D2NYX7_HYPSF|nr:hypothetical protein HYPSUDRAFT_136984 [Hypholoma sublateritium FD-334 SS-4]